MYVEGVYLKSPPKQVLSVYDILILQLFHIDNKNCRSISHSAYGKETELVCI